MSEKTQRKENLSNKKQGKNVAQERPKFTGKRDGSTGI